ncbi:MAG: nickel pincer cofactor biosynthesis protein LarB [Frankia sp.]|nr:nickel pincer cofactor biosynthesis protein LarB [Frankia sp.]
MDRDDVRDLLRRVADGATSVESALAALARPALVGPGYENLGFARVDHQRALRIGDPEVVYGAGKSPAQVVAIVESLRGATPSRPALVTRVAPDVATKLRAHFPDALVDEDARCVVVGDAPPAVGKVVVVAAGTSDGPVAAEANVVARTFGAHVERIDDVGVAGLHRLLDVRPVLDAADVLVVVAGMEGALPSVVGGLVGTPVVAVPTSVGYGASFQGLAALLAMLNSCAPGVAVCNIDNGFGAGVFAARVARAANAARRSPAEDSPALRSVP